ncbi:DUF1642 domain-containing protein [Enterococcus faecalis]|uniref:DUF1642 domain-containing protein n=1 Tax=Enterococcus faecalis TaxID=1351 RepID=UPI0018C20306|nr:DUF1642 domain-containing protein [Enterococcus faecalis]MBG0301789.1 DUF1642 domain-containing protein [Enterococcus faecalis]MBJ0425884.1 DUF1642 domain-containing protein [Enterococcus faecalis]MBJ1163424.1 DUF1642 domain-containing protein [Enterococcus faecalis]MBJ1666930.1 DUF1642 domain-containing protein [Enterococcus faecalis]MBJ1684714.1 DUF1642 domain-containing protein [Enterococcus faecalis]
MNKQVKEDLIQALCDIGGCEAEDEWARGYDDGVNASIEVVKELKVQGKVIFSHEEKFVADWLNDLRGQISNVKLNSGAVFMTFIGRQLERYYDGDYSFLTEKVEGWLTDPENKVKLMSAIDNGYEVEKEQFYYVKMPLTEWNDDTSELETKYVYLTEDITSEEIRLQASNAEHGDWKVKLTEERVKSIDERYWLFAVKVDGE